MEGYAAEYESTAGPVLIHGVRLADASGRPPAPRSGGFATKWDLGDVVAFVYGQGECAEAINRYLSSLR